MSSTIYVCLQTHTYIFSTIYIHVHIFPTDRVSHDLIDTLHSRGFHFIDKISHNSQFSWDTSTHVLLLTALEGLNVPQERYYRPNTLHCCKFNSNSSSPGSDIFYQEQISCVDCNHNCDNNFDRAAEAVSIISTDRVRLRIVLLIIIVVLTMIHRHYFPNFHSVCKSLHQDDLFHTFQHCSPPPSAEFLIAGDLQLFLRCRSLQYDDDDINSKVLTNYYS